MPKNSAPVFQPACAALLLLVAISLSQDIAAQELKPGRLPTDIRKTLKPGLLVEYYQNQKLVDASSIRLPALFIQSGQPVTPFADRVDTIRISGYLKLKLKGSHEFRLGGLGTAQLEINGNNVFEPSSLASHPRGTVDLVKGYNRFVVTYHPPDVGPGKLRVYWHGNSFPLEPVPPTVLFHHPVDSNQTRSAAEGQIISGYELKNQGRDLVFQRRCLNCHETEKTEQRLLRDSPGLSVTADRVNREWLIHWILDPSRMRNDVTMPRLLAGNDSEQLQQAADLAEYILSLGESPSAPVQGDDERGAAIFENLGCVGCHRFSTLEQADEYARISLHFTRAKYKPGAIAAFLQDPRRHFQWSRMPRFRLTVAQCADLEQYIRTESTGKLDKELPGGNSGNGKALFFSAGCANCHSDHLSAFERNLVQHSAPGFGDLKSGKGCLAESPNRESSSSRVPEHPLDGNERAALNRLLDSGATASLATFSLHNFTQTAIREMRCATCHDLDDEQAALPYIIEEEGIVGLPPNRVPMLTYAGEKLLPDWSEKLLAGELGYRVREHFRVQMPGFPVRGKMIAEGLSAIHGFQREENSPHRPDPEKVKLGAAIAAMDTGLSCNRCHAIGDRKPNAAFDAQSTNLIYAANRLRKEYYLRWMLDPLRIDKQTKMPRFSEDRKTTSLKTVLGGDAHAQFEALWHYLNSIRANR